MNTEIFFYILFIILVGVLAWNFRDIASILRKMPFAGMAVLALLLITAVYLRSFVITHEVFFDEPIHLNVAQNIFYHHQLGGTALGSKYMPETIATYGRPGGHVSLIGLAYFLFGESDKSAFLVSSALGALSVGLIFLFAYVFFNSILIAALAGFLVNVFPVHLVYSGSVSSEMSSFFFVSLALFALALFLKERGTGLLFLTAISVVLAVYMRPENVFLLAAFAGFLVHLGYSRKKPAGQVLDAGLFILVLALPLIAQLGWMQKLEAVKNLHFWSPRLLLEHVPGNLMYLWDGKHMTAAYIMFACLGAAAAFQARRAMVLCFSGWLALFFFAYSGHAAGYFAYYNRYFMMAVIPLSILAAVGITTVLERFAGWWRYVLAGAAVIIFILGAVSGVRQIHAYLLSSPAAQEYYFVQEFIRALPDDAPVVTIEPYLVAARTGKRAIQPMMLNRQGGSYSKLYLLKTINWEERDFVPVERSLAASYDFKVLAQRRTYQDTRTFIAELTKKP